MPSDRHWRAIERYAVDQRSGTASVRRLSRETGVPVRTIYAVCRSFSGLSPSAYIRQQRLQLALDMLRRAQPGQTTVTQVATFCGFIQLGRFSQAFRSYHGQLPSRVLRMAVCYSDHLTVERRDDQAA